MGRLDTEVSGSAPGAMHSDERGEAIIVEASDAVGGYLAIPGGTMLLTAEFDRSGPDLVITGKDGTVVVVRDYFSSADVPDLATVGGAVLPEALVARLAGSLAPGQLAQAGQAGGAERIGEVVEVQGNVRIVRADGTVVERAEAGTEIYADDLIETQGGGSVGLLFVDDTSFSLGANARMVVDELVFDPAGASSASFNVVQGAFSFISGEIASAGPNAMTVTTPVATIGIRGTQVAGRAAAEGEETVIVLLPEADGTVGEILVSNASGQVLLTQPNEGTSIFSQFTPPAPPTFLPPSTIQEQFGSNLQILPPQGTQRFQNNNGPQQQQGEGDDRSSDGSTQGEGAPEGEGAPAGEAAPEGEPQQEAEAGEGEEAAEETDVAELGPGAQGEGLGLAGNAGEAEGLGEEGGLAQNADGNGPQLAGGAGQDNAFAEAAQEQAQQQQGEQPASAGSGAGTGTGTSSGTSLSGSFGGTAFQGFSGSVGSAGNSTTTLGGQGQATETSSGSSGSSSGSSTGLSTAAGTQGATTDTSGITVIIGNTDTGGQIGIGGSLGDDDNDTGTVISGPGNDTGFTPTPGGGASLNVLATVAAFSLNNPTAAAAAAGLPAAFVGTAGGGGGFIQNINVGTSAGDQVFGSTGNDLLVGGAGGDVLVGGHGEGDDILIGGTSITEDGDDDDKITYHSTNDGVYVNLGFGSLTVEGDDYEMGIAHGVDGTLSGSGESMTVSGGEIGLDRIFGIEHIDGGKGDDTIIGNAGVNILSGGNMSDTADSGMGDDTLDGAAGADTLIGGIGNDTFIFDTTEFYESFDEGLWQYVSNSTDETIQGGAGHDSVRITSNVDGLDLDAYKDNFDSIEEIDLAGTGSEGYVHVSLSSDFVNEVSPTGTLTISNSNGQNNYSSLYLADDFAYDGTELGADETEYRRFVAADGATVLVSPDVEIYGIENEAPTISVDPGVGDPAAGQEDVAGGEIQVSSWSSEARLIGFSIDSPGYYEKIYESDEFEGEPQFVIQLNPDGSAAIQGGVGSDFQILTTGSGTALLLSEGAVVDSKGLWSGASSVLVSSSYRETPGTETVYVGVRADLGDGYVYGWLAVSYEFNDSDGLIYRVDPQSFYYNPEPGGPIMVGRSDLLLGYEATEDVGITLTGISITDSDDVDGSLPVSVTLSVQNGSLTLDYDVPGGVTEELVVAGYGGAAITITATLAQIQASLAAGGLVYTPAENFNGTDTLSLAVNDQDNAGSGQEEWASRSIQIDVAAVNDAPVLWNNVTLTSVLEGSEGGEGQAVGELFGAVITEVDDGDTLAGVAIKSNGANPLTEGVWQFSSDGESWGNIPTDLNSSNALVLDSSSLIRFVPVAGFHGSPTPLVARAIDTSYTGDFSESVSGEGMVLADVSVAGGSTPFSEGVASVSITVTNVNDAPEIRLAPTGAAEFAGQSNPSMLLSGPSSDFVVSGSTAFTVEAWVKVDALQGDPQTIFQINPSFGDAISVAVNASGELELRNAGAASVISDGAAIVAGSWQHLAFVFENGQVSVYIDGALHNTASGVTVSQGQAASLYLGARSDTSYAFDGQMDDVRFWSEARSAAEIADNYQETVEPSATLVAHYTFDTVSGTVADMAENDHDLTNSGVVAANPAPVLLEGGTAAITGLSFADQDGDTLTVVLSSDTGSLDVADDVNGGLSAGQIAGGGTGTLTLTGSAAAINATLAGAGGLVFSHDGTDEASATVQVVVDDGSESENSSANTQLTLSVTAVNDAPALEGGADLPSFYEDGTPAYRTVSQLFGALVSDDDPEAVLDGIAVVGNTANSETQGVWQFSSDGGSSWFALDTGLSDAEAVMLSASTKLRFVPAEDFNGSAPALSVRAVDGTYSGLYSDSAQSAIAGNVSAHGGTTAFSANTATLGVTVDAVNDAPVVTYTSPALGEIFTDIDRALDGGELSAGEVGLVVDITDPTNAAPDTQSVTGYFSVRKQPSDPDNALMLELVADSGGPVRFLVDNYKEPPAIGSGDTIGPDTNGSWHYEAFVPSPATDRLVAFRIDLGNGDYQYGWLRYSATTDAQTGVRTFELEDLGYSDMPNIGIEAGSDALDVVLSVTEGASVVVEGLSVGDIDGDVLTVVLSTETGTLDINENVLGGLGASAITGNGDSIVTLTGSAAAINATLADAAGVVFTHDGGDDAFTAVVDIDVNDGSGEQNATASTSVSFNIDNVNDAPSWSGNANLAAFLEDGTPSAQSVYQLFGARYGDDDIEASLNGIAVVGNTADPETQGVWQFSSDEGGTWQDISTSLADSEALMLSTSSMLRFQPVENYSGTPPALSVRAVDGSYDGDGYSSSVGPELITADVSAHGGTTAFSANTATLGVTVTAVNDAPTVTVAESGSSAANFGGNDSHIVVAQDDAYLAIGTAFTFEAWINPAALPEGGNTMTLFAGMNGSPNMPSLEVLIEGDGLALRTGYGSGTQFSDTYGTLEAGVWQHVAVTFTTGSAQFYINGEQVGSWTIYSGSQPSDGLVIGAYKNFNGDILNEFVGSMRDVLLFGDARSEAEIQADLEGDVAEGEDGLIGSWPLTEGEGSTASDQSTIRNTGSLQGDVTLVAGAAPREVSEGGTVALEGIAIADADAAGDVTVTLTVEGGGLTVSSAVQDGLSAGDIQGNETGTVTLTGTVAQINATLAAAGGLVYSHGGGEDGAAQLEIQVDDGSGAGNATADATLSISIDAVNDAPQWAGGGANLTAITEDSEPGAGQTVATLLGSQYVDPDPEALLDGIAIVDNPANAQTQGVWQFSSDSGSTWADIPTGMEQDEAVLLSRTTLLRFVPVADFNGSAPSLTVRAVDGSYSGDGYSDSAGPGVITADVTSNGGTTAFSAETATLGVVVSAVNDAPEVVYQDPGQAEVFSDIGAQTTLSSIEWGTGYLGFNLDDPQGYYVGSSPTQDIYLDYRDTPSTDFLLRGSNGNVQFLVDQDNTVYSIYAESNIDGDIPGDAAWSSSAVVVDDVSDRIVAFRVDLGGGDYEYGWLRYTSSFDPGVSSQVFSLNELAASDIPNVAIMAGGGSLDYQQGVVEGGSFALTDFSVQDIDAGAGTLTVTLSSGNGNFAVNTGVAGGVTAVSNNGMGAVTLTGTVAQINATLAHASGVVYTHNGSESPSDYIIMDVNDGGNSGNGGALSSSHTLTLDIDPANDAPELLGNGLLFDRVEDAGGANTGRTVNTMFSSEVWDGDAEASLSGIAVVGNTANPTTEGVWQFSTNGSDWESIPTGASDASALILSASTSIRFVPAQDYNGTPPGLTVRAIDDSYSGAFSATSPSSSLVTANVSVHGESTAFSGNTASIGITITPSNDAPTSSFISRDGVSFDGNGDYITVAPSAAYSGAMTGFTVEAWIRPDSLLPSNSDVQSTILSTVTVGTGHGDGFSVILNSSGKLAVFVYNETSGTGTSLSTDLSVDEWQHIAVTFDDANNSLKFYVNGELAASLPFSATMTDFSDNPLVIGAEYRTNGSNFYYNRFFDGDISDVRLFDTALDASEIAAHYNAPLTGNEDNLVGWWPLDEGSGSTASDHSPTGNNGTLGGNAAFFVDTPAVTVNEGATLSIAPLVIGDIDGDTGVMTVTLSVQNGSINIDESIAGGIAAGSITGDNSGTVTLTGTMQALNATLNTAGAILYTHDGGASTSDGLVVTVDDGSGQGNATSSQTLALTINQINDAPVLTGGANLTSVAEDTNAILTGQTVSSLFGSLVTDGDAGASLAGIAIQANSADSATQGVWQYSTASESWADIPAAFSEASALFLSAGTYLRFVPAANFAGTAPPLTVRAVDDSYTDGFSASNGPNITGSVAVNGGSTAYSDETATLGITVTPVNDAPSIFVPSIQGEAGVAFDGTGDAVATAAGNAAYTDLASGFTISAWINPNNPPGSDTMPFIAGNVTFEPTGSPYTTTGVALTLSQSSGTYRLSSQFGTGTGGANGGISSVPITLGEWQHVAITVDLDNNQIVYYINGQPVSTHNYAGTPVFGDNSFVIGAQEFLNNGNSSYQHGFSGQISDVRFYDYALSSATMAASYDQSLSGAEDGLIGWWPLNDAEGSTATDESSAGYDGVLKGNAAFYGEGEPSLAEGGTFALTGYSVQDIDAGANAITVTLTSSHGSFLVNAAVPGGVGTISGNDDNSITLTGTVDQINTTLAAEGAVLYSHDGSETSADAITITVNDGGNTGSGGALSDTATIGLTIDPVNDAPSVSAGLGGALQLDGVSQYGMADSALTGTDALSVETWVTWAGSATNDDQVIFANGNIGSEPSVGINGFALVVSYDEATETNRLLLRVVVDGDSGLTREFLSDIVLEEGAPTHLAVTMEDGNWTLYVDGDPTMLGHAELDSPVSASFALGRYTATDDGYFHGVLDEVRLWSDLRTAAQIENNRFQVLSGWEAGLFEYFPFDMEGQWLGGSWAGESETQMTLEGDPESVASPAPLFALQEYGAVTLSGIQIGDPELEFLGESAPDITVVLQSDIGMFMVDTGNLSIAVDGDFTNAVTLTGTMEDVNLLLDGGGMFGTVQFNAWGGESGQYGLTITVNDGGVSGSGTNSISTTTLTYDYEARDETTYLPGAALQFDGDDLVVAGGPGDFNFEGDFTIEAWINPVNTTLATLLDTRQADGTNGVVLSFDETGALVFQIVGENGLGEPLSLTTLSDQYSTINTGEWTHLAVRVDADVGITLFVNGEQSLSAFVDTSAMDFAGIGGLRLGQAFDGQDGFIGQMNEIRIWNEARSNQEIADNHDRLVDPADSGLLAYWNADDAVAGIMADITGNDRDAVLGGGLGNAHAPTIVSPLGTAVSLDGLDDVIRVSNDPSFADTDEGTWSIWFRSEADWGSDNASAGAGQGATVLMSLADEDAEKEGMTLLLNPDGSLEVQIKDINGIVHAVGAGQVSSDLTDGIWHNVSVTYGKDAGDSIGIYVDGELAGSFQLQADWEFAAGEELTVGGSASGTWEEFKGEIAEFAAWNRKLSATEIDMLALEGVEINDTGLVVWQSFDTYGADGAVFFSDSASSSIQTILDAGADSDSEALAKLFNADAPVMGESGTGYEGMVQTGLANPGNVDGDYTFSVNGVDQADDNGFIHVTLASGAGEFYLHEQSGRWYYVPGADAVSGVPLVTISVTDGFTTEQSILTLTVQDYDSPNEQGGTVLQFDANDSVSFGRGDSNQLAIVGNMTVEFWLNPASAADGAILRFGPDGNPNPNSDSTNVLYEIGINDSGQIYFYSQGEEAGPNDTVYFDQYTATADSWQQIAVVRDVGGESVSLYVNGALVQSIDYTTVAVGGSQSVLTMGGSGFAGAVDEVRLWADVRTASEIRANHDQVLSTDEGDLVAYWRMENASGGAVTDLMGGAQGTVSGLDDFRPDFVPNFLNSVATGSANSGLVVADSNTLDMTTDFTIEAWIRPQSLNGEQTIIDKAGAYRLYLLDDELVLALVDPSEGTIGTTMPLSIEVDAWTHVAVRFEEGAVQFFINGELAYSEYPGVQDMDPTSSALGIGSNGTASGAIFNGQIADLRLWSDGRTDAEISENYLTPLVNPADETDLAGYWTFNVADGDVTVSDLSGNGNNAQIIGDVSFPNGMALAADTVIHATEGQVAFGRWQAEELGATPSYAINGGATADGWSVKTTDAGTLRVNIATGDWTFSPADGTTGAFTGANGFTITASSAAGNASTTLAVDITDLPDAAAFAPSTVLSFDGDDHLLVPNEGGLNVGAGDDFTYEAWVNWDGTPATGTIFSTMDAGGLKGVSLEVQSNGTLTLIVKNTAESPSVYQQDLPSAVAAGEWTHLAVSVDRDGDTLFVVNGVVAATLDTQTELGGTGLPATFDASNSQPGYIGNSQSGTIGFNGLMDEVRVWSAPRSAAEITENYNRQLSGDESGLVGNWRFDDGNGSPYRNEVAYGSHAYAGARVEVQRIENPTPHAGQVYQFWLNGGWHYSNALAGSTVADLIAAFQTEDFLTSSGVTLSEDNGDLVITYTYPGPRSAAELKMDGTVEVEAQTVVGLTYAIDVPFFDSNLNYAIKVGATTYGGTSGVANINDLVDYLADISALNALLTFSASGDDVNIVAVSTQSISLLITNPDAQLASDDVVGTYFDNAAMPEQITHLSDALLLDGEGEVTTPLGAQTDGDFTIAGWFRVDTLGEVQYLVSKGTEVGENTDILVYVDTDGTLRLEMDNGSADRYSSTGAIAVGEWHHFALVNDNGIMWSYLDGQSLGANGISSRQASEQPVIFGAYDGNGMTGALDDLSVWNAALSLGDVRDLMDGPPDLTDGNLLAYYNFTGTDGATAVDGSQNGNNATITGGVLEEAGLMLQGTELQAYSADPITGRIEIDAGSTISLYDGPDKAGSSISLNAETGEWTFTAAVDLENYRDSFSFQVTDSSGQTRQITYSVDVSVPETA